MLLTKVEVLKPTEHKNFAIVDAAMNDLIRPSLYGSQMAVLPCVLPSGLVQSYSSVEAKTWDIVGQVCETGDFLAKNRVLSLAVGDILAITGAGAYGFAMSSNYNTRPRACEVMVDDHDYQKSEPVKNSRICLPANKLGNWVSQLRCFRLHAKIVRIMNILKDCFMLIEFTKMHGLGNDFMMLLLSPNALI